MTIKSAETLACIWTIKIRLVYDNYELTSDELLEKDGPFAIHHYNIQTLCIELYKVYHNL